MGSVHEECPEHKLQCKKIEDLRVIVDKLGCNKEHEHERMWDAIGRTVSVKILIVFTSVVVTLMLAINGISVSVINHTVGNMEQMSAERKGQIVELFRQNADIKREVIVLQSNVNTVQRDVDELKGDMKELKRRRDRANP